MSNSLIQGPFDVSEADLSRLTADDAVQVFHHLLVTEAIGAGRSVTSINVPKSITTADGGVDADVELAQGALLPSGLLRSGSVRYQIKTGGFSVSTNSDIKSLLLQPKFHEERAAYKPEHLNPRVKSCLDKSGLFVIVLFGSDAVGRDDGYGSGEIVEYLKKIDPVYGNAKIEIIRANQICAAIRAISPGLALRLKGLAGGYGAPFETLEFLEKSCALEVAKYQLTENLKKLSSAISTEADHLEGFKHIRILGDAGAGKTHLAFVGLNSSILKANTLYCPASDELDGSPAFSQLIQLSKTASVILVADECDYDTAYLLQVRLKKIASHFLLITVFNQVETDTALGDTVQIVDVPQLTDDAMKRIFEDYGIPADRVGWLADLCKGSPRAAHQIGQYISSNPNEDYDKHFSKLDSMWENMVCSPDSRESPIGQARLTVARTMALFRRVAWGGNQGPEGKVQIEKLLALADRNISTATIAGCVKALQKRRILQGKNVLYLSPKLLHVKLWCDWWDTFGHLIDEAVIRSVLKDQMLEWFVDMFKYAKESKAATAVVEKLLSEEGPLANLVDFSKPGNPQLFFALAQADSKVALRRLKLTLEKSNVNELLKFSAGRREVVHGLERLAVPATNFIDAAECLLMLAEAENETWSNNASGVFVSLFSLGYGKLAASEFSPTAKLPYLRNLLKSENKNRRQLALRAIEESLRPFMSRTDIGDMAGLKPLPERWMPKTYGELWDAYGKHVELISEAFGYLPADERAVAAKAIVGNARSLVEIQPLSNQIISLLKQFSKDEELRGPVVEAIISTLHYDRKTLPSDTVLELERLKSDLTENTIHDKVRRYAGLRLVEDSFTEEGDYTEAPHPELISLCNAILKEPEILNAELPWLVTDEAKNGFQFGIILGKSDVNLTLWPVLKASWLLAGSRRTDFFLGGYLAGIFENGHELWEQLIAELFEIPDLIEEVLQLVWRSGMTDSVALELLARCETGAINARDFRILVYGGVVRNLPMDMVKKLLNKLAASDDPRDAPAALDILQSRIRANPDDIDELIDLLEHVLRNNAFVSGGAKQIGSDQMRDYYWTEGAKRLLTIAPERALQLATHAMKTFGNKGSVTDAYMGASLSFFDQVLEKWPKELWQSIGCRIQPKIDSSAYRLLQWLRGDLNDGRSEARKGFAIMPPAIVLDWIDEKSADRARLVAEYCPKVISAPGETPNLARLILERYGAQKEVRQALHANFMSGVFWGPASESYQKKLDATRSLLNTETNEFVKLWLLEEINRLTIDIQNEIEREESGNF